nr:serine/threonine-protein kinase [Calditrichia bacterium]
MIGKQILHYHITEKLGSGGMGVVFKAHDSRLNRSVALKFLPPRFSKNENVRKRFLQEAQAASALDHPNICNIHNFYQTRSGQMFICMAYYEGRSLKVVLQEGGLSLDDILSFSVQLARGLARGHEAGITHRDIKPANLIITPRGELKIVDFGLAKLSGRARLTRAGIVLGTPGYMSPEQALGRTVDHRTDIWSLGVVMFEMLVGHLPFSGKDDAAMLQSILTKSPRSLEHLKAPLEVELRKIIEKTLAKNPRHRYQSMAEVLADLILLLERKPDNSPREAQSGDDVRTSIVVLPFKDVSPEHDQEYFCDGLTEELINSLSRIKELKVVSRTSAFQFKGREADIREIGSILNVHTILEGSIRKAGNKVRITAQLVNVADGFHLWSEQFERELKDVFAIQDSI